MLSNRRRSARGGVAIPPKTRSASNGNAIPVGRSRRTMPVHAGATANRVTKSKSGSSGEHGGSNGAGNTSNSSAAGAAESGGNGSSGSGGISTGRTDRSVGQGRGGTGTTAAAVSAGKMLLALRDMEPPVSSFYGAEPIPLPPRFANIKRRLVAGREAAVEASWRRLLAALRSEIAHVESRRGDIVPAIDFDALDDPVKAECFGQSLRRYGVGIIRGVVPPTDAAAFMADTRDYLDHMREIKPPPTHDPTCFDLFWTPAQVRTRAHPNVRRAQKFAMGFWETGTSDMARLATRFPIVYGDRLHINNYDLDNVRKKGGGGSGKSENSALDSRAGPVAGGGGGTSSMTEEAAAITSSSTAAAQDSSTIIFQVDNGSLERWEPDGYGRSGAYDAIFRGEWEAYDPWQVAGRLGTTPDLYNGAGTCSIFRLFQGILAVTPFDRGMIRILPNPKLVTAYFLLRPFFSPRRKKPPSPLSSWVSAEGDGLDDPDPDPDRAAEWAAFLDADNWAMDADQSTIIHGAVPGHAQRITDLWHPHLHLRRTTVELPALETGDYIIWHCDEPYSIGAPPKTEGATAFPTSNSTSNSTSSSPTTSSLPSPSVLVYIPACPLTQTNALYMARQRKAMLKGEPGPDFDRIGLGFGTEQPRTEESVRGEITAVGGDEGLRAMGLEPFDAPTTTTGEGAGDRMDVDGEEDEGEARAAGTEEGGEGREGKGRSAALTPRSDAEAELVRMANIILFPDRYDFYMPAAGSGASGNKAKR